MAKPALNRRFPACAQVARRLLAEVYGCEPGDLIPGEDELLARARQVIDAEWGKVDTAVVMKANVAAAMVGEIGGIFEVP
jgi:hypothetical protein